MYSYVELIHHEGPEHPWDDVTSFEPKSGLFGRSRTRQSCLECAPQRPPTKVRSQQDAIRDARIRTKIWNFTGPILSDFSSSPQSASSDSATP